MASELALIINTTGNDSVLKIMLPRIKEKFEKNFPELHLIYQYLDNKFNNICFYIIT